MPALSRSERRIREVLEDIYDELPPRHKLTKREAEALIGNFQVQTGNGIINKASGPQQSLCFLQTANVMNAVLHGEEVQGGVSPEYTGIDEIDPLLEQFGFNFNDSIENSEKRRRLLEFVPRLFKTSVGPATEARQRLMRDQAAKIVEAELVKGNGTPLGFEVEDFITPGDLSEARCAAVYGPRRGWDYDAVKVGALNQRERRLVAKNIANSADLPESLGGYYGAKPEEGFEFLDKLLRVRGSRK